MIATICKGNTKKRNHKRLRCSLLIFNDCLAPVELPLLLYPVKWDAGEQVAEAVGPLLQLAFHHLAQEER